MRWHKINMKAIFTRTGERRYMVSVEGPGIVSSVMDPAPGYDPRMPHDMAHFIVENELGLKGGVFGQLAAGGHANSFRSTAEKRSGRKTRTGDRIAKENRDDANLSELVVNLACRTWTDDPEKPDQVKGVSQEDIARICRVFDSVGAEWSKLRLGESLTLEWRHGVGAARHR
jgi:hypothetical protein